MKNKVMLIIVMLLTVFMGENVFADIPVAKDGIDKYECLSFASGAETIRVKDYYHRFCYEVVCSAGVYSKRDQVHNNYYTCENKNYNPYVRVSSDGCSNYSGTCNTYNSRYCTKVLYIDCTRKSDGSNFGPIGTNPPIVNPTVPPTTKKPTTTTKKPITTKKTTTTRKPGTTQTMPTIPVDKPTTTKAPEVTNNTQIKKITVNNTDIKYNESKDTYTLKLLYDITDVNVDVELVDPTSTFEVIGNTGMPNEEHEIKVIVTAVSGDKREVTLKIKRYTNLNNDCTLANIYSEEYPIEFSPNTYSYKITLPKNVSTLDFEVLLSDEENASYSVEGNEKLKNRSTIKIDVRAEDGTTCQYTIKIKKESNTWKYIVAIALLVGVLAVSSVLLYRYLKKSKGRYKYE